LWLQTRWIKRDFALRQINVANAQAVLSEPELLRAMFVVSYFPPNTPPGE
jgi:hypothetical protein